MNGVNYVEEMIEIHWDDWSTTDGPARALKLGPIDRWEAIEVHHGGSPYTPGADILKLWDRYRAFHEDGRGWSTIWYHLGIHPDGRLASLRGPLAGNSSRKYLTVNLPGHGSQTTEAQWHTLRNLRISLALDGGGTELRYHAQRGGTSCPGKEVIDRIHGIWEEEKEMGGLIVSDSREPTEGMIEMQHPVVALLREPSETGYATVHADGGVATFGGFTFRGSIPGLGIDILGHRKYPDEIVDAASTAGGYYMVSKRGAIYGFGTAEYLGRVSVTG